eukprot:jgi/Mesvir1/18504/Mv25473-RA.1
MPHALFQSELAIQVRERLDVRVLRGHHALVGVDFDALRHGLVENAEHIQHLLLTEMAAGVHQFLGLAKTGHGNAAADGLQLGGGQILQAGRGSAQRVRRHAHAKFLFNNGAQRADLNFFLRLNGVPFALGGFVQAAHGRPCQLRQRAEEFARQVLETGYGGHRVQRVWS